MKFAITAMGRCGTASFAAYLGAAHESENQVVQDVVPVQTRFDAAADGYGEVNSYLREVFPELQRVRKAVIWRHPMRVLFNALERHGYRPKEDVLEDVISGLSAAWYAGQQKDTVVFRFEEVVPEPHIVARWAEVEAGAKLPNLNRSAPFEEREVQEVPGHWADVLRPLCAEMHYPFPRDKWAHQLHEYAGW